MCNLKHLNEIECKTLQDNLFWNRSVSYKVGVNCFLNSDVSIVNSVASVLRSATLTLSILLPIIIIMLSSIQI